MSKRPARRVPIILAADEWDRLVTKADAEGRDPFQQARWLVVQGIKAARSASEIVEETADVA